MRTKGSKSRSQEQLKDAVVQTITENRHCDIAKIMMSARMNQILAKRILAELITSGLVVSIAPASAGITDARVSAVYARNVII